MQEVACVEGAVLGDCNQHAKHSLSWWRSDIAQQRRKTPHTQCLKVYLEKAVNMTVLKGAWSFR